LFSLKIPPFNLNETAGIAARFTLGIQCYHDVCRFNMSDVRIVTVDDGPSAKLGRDVRLALKYHGRSFVGGIDKAFD
jgi:hypothetical protein